MSPADLQLLLRLLLCLLGLLLFALATEGLVRLLTRYIVRSCPCPCHRRRSAPLPIPGQDQIAR